MNIAPRSIKGKWRHIENGDIYDVIGVANIDAKPRNADKFPLRVVFRGENGSLWDRPIDEFLEKFSALDNDKPGE